MRLLDKDNDRALKNLGVYLTIDEAKEVLGDLQQLIEHYSGSQHAHISDTEYEHEITLVVYLQDDLEQFDARSKTLIEEDK